MIWKNKYIMFSVCGIYRLLCSAQTENDTTKFTNELNEVVVTAPENQTNGGSQLFYPSKDLKKSTNNGIQILAGLQIPDLIINPATGTIERIGGGAISIRINGHPATIMDLSTISPQNIFKIEYISDPGVRYGDVKCVINIHVKRRETGYGVSLNLLQAVNRGWGNYTGAVKYTAGQSEWTLDFNSNPMWNISAFRNNTEHYILSDGKELLRHEEGLKRPNRMETHRLSLQYSYAIGNKLLINAQLRMTRKNDNYISEGLITTLASDGINEDFERELLPIKSTQIDADLYLFYKINKTNKLYFNIVPSILKGSNARIYQTTDIDLYSRISNDGYHMLSEGIWESNIGNGTISSGIRGLEEWNKAVYDNMTDISEKSIMGNLFAEWKQTLNNIQYDIEIGGTLYNVTTPSKHTYINANPRIYLRYTPWHWGGFSFNGNVKSICPTVNQLNPFIQRVDQYQWSKGAPEVATYQRFDTKIEFDGILHGIWFKLTLHNTYNHKPIMGAKTYVNDMIVKTYYNNGFNNNLIMQAQLRLPLFIKQLNLSLEGGWHKTISKGLNYRHEYSQPFINAQIMYANGPLWAMIKYNTAYNVLWGEEITSTNNNMLNIGIGYTYRNATFMAGAFNPIGTISQKSKDLSSIAGFDRIYHISSTHQLFWVGLTLNLYSGKKRGMPQRKLNNSQSYESINNVRK